jgi:hypothetical protein
MNFEKNVKNHVKDIGTWYRISLKRLWITVTSNYLNLLKVTGMSYGHFNSWEKGVNVTVPVVPSRMMFIWIHIRIHKIFFGFGYGFCGHAILRTIIKSFLLMAKEQLMYSARRKKVFIRENKFFFSLKFEIFSALQCTNALSRSESVFLFGFWLGTSKNFRILPGTHSDPQHWMLPITS